MRYLLDAALAKRDGMHSHDTNALRLIDGAGDDLNGLCLESYADRWLLSLPHDQAMHPEVLDWLNDRSTCCYLKSLDPHQKSPPNRLLGPEISDPFLIREHGASYEISFQSGYSQGIFLDQRDNRAEVRRLLHPGQRMLNTFAYTGGFSISAALAGAETTTLDLSQPYLDWAKRNFTHNHIDPKDHHFCKGDAFHWLRRFAKQGRTFDAIVLDPPTFSRNDQGDIFRAEHHFGQLAALAAALLAPNGWILCCTNSRSITAREFERQLLSSLPRPLRPSHSPMPSDFTDVPYLKSVWLR